MKDTATTKIIKLLNQESPLTPKQIAGKLKIPSSTVRAVLTMLKSMGLVRYYDGMIRYDPAKGRAYYELTPEGKARAENLFASGDDKK